MANYLITSPSSETVGTDSNDLFVLQSIQGNTVFGLEGNDTITAGNAAASSVLLNAGADNDIINVTAGSLFEGNIYAGSGNDSLILDRDFSASVIRGGTGNDSIFIEGAGALDRTTVNGNDNADFISAAVAVSNSSFFGGGKGKDTLNFDFISGAAGFTINGGEGHDSLVFGASGAGSLSSFAIAGGDGYDTIVFEDLAANNLSSNFIIEGGALNDLMRFQSGVTTTVGSATIGGGAGADTIQFSAGVSLANGYINAGAGHDSVYISAAFNNGTLNGGAGADSITLGTYAASASNGGLIVGGLGADSISLGAGSFAATTGSRTVVGASGGSVLGYTSFDQSNLAEFDSVSAGATITQATGTISGTQDANLFTISQDVVSSTVGASLAVANFSTNSVGAVTFTSTFSNLLTARVEEIDKTLAVGQTVAFSNGAGTERYVFMQGGAASSGTAGDLLIKVNSADVLVGGGSAMIVQKRVVL